MRASAPDRIADGNKRDRRHNPLYMQLSTDCARGETEKAAKIADIGKIED